MSILKSEIARIESKIRQHDEGDLLQVTRRDFDTRVSRTDDKVFEDTGKTRPSFREKWKNVGREKAQRDSDEQI